MAVIDNKATEIGDVLLIIGNIPLIGILALSTYTDTTIGETSNRFFNKTFRYSIDGLTYSPWQELSNENLELINIAPQDTFFIEYRYERAGTDATGDLEFVDVILNGEFQDPITGKVLGKSIFSQLLTLPDTNAIKWSVNVLQKVYGVGLVPTYIVRNGNNAEDRDFIDFYRTTTYFFALIVMLARRYDRFRFNDSLIQRYIENRGLYYCKNQSVDDLIYLKENYYKELFQRGTTNIYKEDGSYIGELLRLICYLSSDEFIFDYIPDNKFAWFVDECSPCYQGINEHPLANKAWENTQDFIDITKYPLLEESYCSIETDSDRECLKIEDVPNGVLSGIGSLDNEKVIKVDSTVDYEITFWFKTSNIANTNLYFGCIGYDEDGNLVQFVNMNTGLNSNLFYNNKKALLPDTWYFVRGILYNCLTPSALVDIVMENKWGYNMRMNWATKSISPIIGVNSDNDENDLLIWDVKVRPLVLGQSITTIYLKGTDTIEYTPATDNVVYQGAFSPGFVQVNNFIAIWMKQNNKELTDSKLEEIIRRYLMPYNTAFKNVYIKDLIIET